MKKILTTLCLASIASVATQAVEYEISNDVPIDTFVVKDEISVPNVNKIGMNYNDKGYNHWKSAIMCNIWNRVGGFEPRVLTNWGLVAKGGDNSFVCDRGWALNAFGIMKSGFWDGAEVDVFGMKDGKFDFKRRSKLIKSVSGGSKVVDTYTLENDGGKALVAGDWVYLKMIELKPNPHQKTETKRGRKIRKTAINSFNLEVHLFPNNKWELVMDPCPEAGSTAAMKITTNGMGGYWSFHTPGDKGKFNHWIEGEFKWEGWLKRSTPGTVQITMGGRNPVVDKSFEVGTTWEKYEFDFNPVELFKNDNSKISKYQVMVPDSCELYLDNIMIYKKGIEPFAMLPRYKEKLKEFTPGMLRPYTGLERRSMDVFLTKGIAQAQERDATRGGNMAQLENFTLVTELELARDLKSNPWIFLPGMLRLEDCDNLMEYLGAPSNIGYGKLRAKHGQKKPYTTVFKDIYIEAGDEQWGTNFSHCFPGKPHEYARLAEMYFTRLKASPYYDSKKMKFIVNGFLHKSRGSWHEVAGRSCPSADINDSGFYIGGWDGVTIEGDSVAALYQSRMFNAPHVVRKERIEIIRTDRQLGENIAKVLSEKPSVAKSVLKHMKLKKSRGKLKHNMSQIIAMVMRNPGKDVLYGMFTKSEAGKKFLLKTLGIENFKNDYDLSRVLQKRFQYMAELVKKYPKEMIAFGNKHNLNNDAKKAILDISEGRKPERPWTVLNAVQPKIKAIVMPALKSDPILLKDMDSIVKNLNIYSMERKSLKTISNAMSPLIKREMATLFSRVKSGEIKLIDIANDKNIFENEASQIAKKIAETLKNQIDNYKSNGADLDALDDKNRQIILDALAVASENDQLTLAKDSLMLFNKVARSFYSKDSSDIESIATNKVFIEELRRRILNQFGDAIIELMIEDNDIADALLFDYEKIPKDPRTGGKLNANYEAGPGYQLPGPGKEPAEEEETFGKSLALGLATLDGFLYDMERKFTYMNYFQFGFGNYWSTYSDNVSWRRNPSYEALLMVNQYTDGNMMRVDHSGVKKINIPTATVKKLGNNGKPMKSTLAGVKNIKITKCYAFQDGKKHSFVMFNRSFTESRTIKLDLPYNPSSKAVLHKLSANSPSDTNRKELLVKQTEIKVDDFKNGYEIKLTPGEILMINNNEK